MFSSLHLLCITFVVYNHLLEKFLLEWQLRRIELRNGTITKEEYDEWMWGFPATSDNCGKSEPERKWRR
ncbi:MAG: hypothetical protein MSH60_15660 [Ruminococcus sp.]|nr:hypothetical protein [Ruminococcus sp.]